MLRAIFGWGSSSSSPPRLRSQKRKEALKVNNSLYELHMPEGTPTTMQVLLFHGLGSGDMSNAHLMTWETEDGTCIWPQEWLPEVFPGLHVFTVSYSECARNFDMYLLGENLILDIIQGGIGQTKRCPIILVGHCVGGLAIKAVCCRADKNRRSSKTGKRDKERLDMFLQNIRGIFYYSTPHHGSSVPQNARAGGLFKFFEILNNEAARLNDEFQDLEISHPKWQIYAVGECLSTTSSKRVKVPEASSRQGAVKFYTVPTADHISICQPSSRKDVRFYHLEGLINMIAAELEEEAVGLQETAGQEAQPQTLQHEAHKSLAIEKTILTSDNIYVPIQYSQSELIKAIEEPGGYHVILLHGGVGKGKSTLARCMYVHYGQEGEGDNLFEHVFWLSCANCSIQDTSTKQFEILQDLSPHSLLGDFTPKEKSGTKQRINNAYRDFLRGKKILIILDDVSDSRFLCEMWKGAMGAKDVRYLVTSQKSNICNNLKNDSIRIAMGNPTQDEARNILASLVGLEGRVIPDHLQEIADKMIEITEANPLALACLASHFAYNQDNEDKQAWQDAYRDLRKLLDSPDENIVLGNTESAPRSLWAAMKICVDSLETVDAKSMLSWMYACRSEIVPEMVLRIWYHSIKKGTFQRSKDELVMRELVKIIPGTMTLYTNLDPGMGLSDEEQEEATSWSLCSLVKLYMEVNMVGTQDIKSVIEEMIGVKESSSELTVECEGAREMEVESEGACEMEVENEGACEMEVEREKARIVMALCALYFDPHHIDRTVTGAVTRVRNICNIAYSDDDINDLRRKAVEPMIWLLDKLEADGQWTESVVLCVRKVLLSYVCNCQLDDENISLLLKLDASATARLATLNAICQICGIEEKRLFGRSTLNFVQVIVHLVSLNEGLPTAIQVAASRAIRAVCWKAAEDRSTRLIVDTPGVLDVLVSSLAVSNPRSSVIPEAAASALYSLSYGDGKDSDGTIEGIILSKEGTIVNLVNCLFKQDMPGLQREAAGALANLACGRESNAMRVGDQEGAVNGLVKLLSAQDKPEVQRHAARALRNLAGREALHLQVANQEEALVGLIRSLTVYTNPSLQEHAAGALAKLANNNESIRMKIGNEEGALDDLVKLLSAEGNYEAQVQAARTIRNLAGLEALRPRIAKQEGALVALLRSLTAHNNTGLQENAIATLVNLTRTESIGIRIAYEDGMLEGLVKLLFEQEKPKVRQYATWAIRNIAALDDNTLKLWIVKGDRAFPGLVKCLAQQDHPELQHPAASALSYLAELEEAKAIFQGTEGLVRGLTSLLDGVPPSTQLFVAYALTLISPTAGKEGRLTSGDAFVGRARACIFMGMYTEALPDLDQAVDLLHGADDILLQRCFVKTKLEDMDGALEDANEAVKVSHNGKPFALQERGILKRIIGDLEGAKADFDEGLKLETDDYERLKHRGFVKFLMKDEEGAREDANWALRIKPSRVDRQDYGKGACLGAAPVEYLGYKFK